MFWVLRGEANISIMCVGLSWATVLLWAQLHTNTEANKYLASERLHRQFTYRVVVKRMG